MCIHTVIQLHRYDWHKCMQHCFNVLQCPADVHNSTNHAYTCTYLNMSNTNQAKPIHVCIRTNEVKVRVYMQTKQSPPSGTHHSSSGLLGYLSCKTHRPIYMQTKFEHTFAVFRWIIHRGNDKCHLMHVGETLYVSKHDMFQHLFSAREDALHIHLYNCRLSSSSSSRKCLCIHACMHVW
jgi:hypothetical protein